MKREMIIKIRGNRSQQEMANMLGISQQHYSSIELGNRGIKPNMFKKFEEIFGESINKLAPDIFLENNTTKRG